jgi:hypothetical protein
MSVVGAVVDWAAMLQVVWVSIASGLGVTAVFALALLGTTRAMEFRRNGRSLEAAAFGTLALVGSAGVAAAVVLAIVVMTHK